MLRRSPVIFGHSPVIHRLLRVMRVLRVLRVLGVLGWLAGLVVCFGWGQEICAYSTKV